MSDQKLRELERRWKETGAVEDEAAYLLERVRVGDLTQERLELAAYCGHEGARRATNAVAPEAQAKDLRDWVEGLAHWPERPLRELVGHVVREAMTLYSSKAQEPRLLLALVSSFEQGRTDTAAIEAAWSEVESKPDPVEWGAGSAILYALQALVSDEDCRALECLGNAAFDLDYAARHAETGEPLPSATLRCCAAASALRPPSFTS